MKLNAIKRTLMQTEFNFQMQLKGMEQQGLQFEPKREMKEKKLKMLTN